MSGLIEQECTAQQRIPQGFERYFDSELPPVVSSRDLLPSLSEIESPEARELQGQLEVLYHIELKPDGSTRRDVVLMKDSNNHSSLVVVCRDMNPPQDRDTAYGSLAVIGGCGVYDTPKDQVPITYAINHTKLLSVVMRRKTHAAGLRLGGMKATIPGESDWEKSPVLQQATGYLFSGRGIFSDAITGSDARQTPDTIQAMTKGSELGGDHQIAGMFPELDTPASVRFSLEQSYNILALSYGKEKIPPLHESTVLVEGFGRIGRSAVRLMLEKGAHVVVSDPLLTNEDYLLPDLPNLERTKQFIAAKYKRLKDRYGDALSFVPTEGVVHHKADIFCPCSSSEGSLDEEKIDQLASNGVRLILAGQNNPFGEHQVWQRAHYAQQKGILMPPEILTNCGSVTAAAMEPILRIRQREDPTMNAERFVHEYVIPFIAINMDEKLSQFKAISEQKGVDLYSAGEIAYCEAFGKSYAVDADGILHVV